MISSIRGRVLAVTGATAHIEVGGVGYAVLVTPEHAIAMTVGHDTFLHTTLIVREDAMTLFGFETVEHREVFDLLLGVAGVGPKSALGVLSHLGPGQIAAAVAADDDASFRKVSGIGPKTAKLIVVSLAGKLLGISQQPERSAVPVSAGSDVVSALVGLGWPERVAAAAVDDVATAHPEAADAPVQTLLRLALAQLGPAPRNGSSA
ncbi:Holliday junction DNA helicase subunit RuvA [Labedella gwakjiensis]|uniref:Holliday junction branch migration complex subunit RuvA n=1 Tax=Labedella gwakjiensis TaxID=390269 RepID=A0A2P8GZR1_9MICO|nr:Holliday junction branch migration protein RuvA [Labedella gwakjiensis]PSL39456.1 Holliday junction DNA helicase subunit RuvA [Labedella gwakjiensis]RUQ86141.1 Holliday junction branch migration protein RuvA [Labedella gwakjiensis]